MITDPFFYLVAIPAVLLTGISKGGFGSALGGVAVPLMALAISPQQGAAIMLPVLCLMDVVGMRVYFRQWDTRILKALIPGALIGIALGTLSFGALDEHRVRFLLGLISVGFVLLKLVLTKLAERQQGASAEAVDPTKAPSAASGLLFSALAGFTSFVAHAGGPPITMYLLTQGLPVVRYVATINVFFLMANAVKLIPYAMLGQFSSTNLLASLSLAPLVPIGVWTGLWLQNRINTVWFFRIAQTGLLLTGVFLMVQGLQGG